MNPKVDTYFDKLEKWQKELETLRMIILDCGLTEELKWGAPCYAFQHSNILIIGGLKEYCLVSFFKGALLNDAHGVLVRPGEHSQAARLIPFTNVRAMPPVLMIPQRNGSVIAIHLSQAQRRSADDHEAIHSNCDVARNQRATGVEYADHVRDTTGRGESLSRTSALRTLALRSVRP